ncbi:MAG: DUF2029 domain-containing protein [Chloroflexota bacterium]|nr:DUF2029 domain-containing protein [Chloroflexota bacterium]MDQ5866163.1 DUF2029 domain-containing protein [Chloroflexota bacterium]
MAVAEGNYRTWAAGVDGMERTTLHRGWRLLAWAGGFVVALLLMLAWGATTDPRNDFAQNVWLPARLVLDGSNPYFPARTEVDAALGAYSSYFSTFNSGSQYHFIYPMWVALFTAPFAMLPLDLSTALWRALSLVLLVWACGSILRAGNRDLRKYTPAALAALGLVVLACIFFRANVLNLYLGQFAVIELGLLAAIWSWLVRSVPNAASRWPWGDMLAGLGLAVLAVKPHSVGLVVVLLGLWAISRRRFVIPVSAVVSLAALLIVPLVAYPTSLGDFLSIVVGGQASSQAPVSASVWGVSYALLGEQGPWVAVSLALSVLGVGLLLPRWWRDFTDSSSVVPLSLPLTLCVNSVISPYLLGYEHVLLLMPALVLLSGLGLPVPGGESAETEATSRKLLRTGIFLWLLVLPLANGILHQAAQSEYPLILVSSVMLAICWAVRPANIPAVRTNPARSMETSQC